MPDVTTTLPIHLRVFVWKRRSVRGFAKSARRLGGTVGRVRLRHRAVGRDRLRFERSKGGVTILLDTYDLSAPDRRWVPKSRMPTLLAQFSLTTPALRAIEADMSDGEWSGPGIVCFSSFSPEAILVPDPHFVTSRGYAQYRALNFDPADVWQQRSDVVRWRGSTTGTGGDVSNEAMDPATLIQRAAMCLTLRDVPGVDAKIVGVVQTDAPELARERFARAGILGEWVNPMSWLGCRYAIDIDGNSNAWSNLFTRLLLGNCVIKIASPHGYRQWYYDRLRPNVHYVPVRADMSDLVEKIEWCRANPHASMEIARAGRALALSMTLESELRDAVARLDALA